jgi:hypothetical protein
MADFRAEFTAGASPVPWDDPASGSRPGRLNPRAEHPHLRHEGSLGVQVSVSARIGGVLAPLDAALGGELFSAFLAESPVFPAPPVSNPVGQSSVQRFTPLVAGHYTLRMVREAHGSLFVHVDVY